MVTEHEGAGPAAGKREPAVRALSRAERGGCGARALAEGLGRAGPAARGLRPGTVPHGRVAERAPGRLVCGASGREMLGEENWRGAAWRGGWEGAPGRPGPVSAHALGRWAAVPGAVR